MRIEDAFRTEPETKTCEGNAFLLARINRTSRSTEIVWDAFDEQNPAHALGLDDDEKLLAGLTLVEDAKSRMSPAARKIWDQLELQLEADWASQGLDVEVGT